MRRENPNRSINLSKEIRNGVVKSIVLNDDPTEVHKIVIDRTTGVCKIKFPDVGIDHGIVQNLFDAMCSISEWLSEIRRNTQIISNGSAEEKSSKETIDRNPSALTVASLRLIQLDMVILLNSRGDLLSEMIEIMGILDMFASKGDISSMILFLGEINEDVIESLFASALQRENFYAVGLLIALSDGAIDRRTINHEMMAHFLDIIFPNFEEESKEEFEEEFKEDIFYKTKKRELVQLKTSIEAGMEAKLKEYSPPNSENNLMGEITANLVIAFLMSNAEKMMNLLGRSGLSANEIRSELSPLLLASPVGDLFNNGSQQSNEDLDIIIGIISKELFSPSSEIESAESKKVDESEKVNEPEK